MAKTVTIPNNMQPNWECEINGIKYSYPAGTEQNVPDSVADLIANAEADKPREEPRGFRLLNKVQISEDVGIVEFTKDLEGNSLNIKKAVVRIYAIGRKEGVLSDKPSTTQYSTLYFNNAKVVTTQITTSNYYSYLGYEAEYEAPFVVGAALYRGSSTGIEYSSYDVMNSSMYAISGNYRGRSIVEYDSVEAVKVDVTGVEFKEGTYFELWGE